MDDDFNSPGGLAVLFELAKNLRREGNLLTHEVKTATDLEDLQRQWLTLVHLAEILGLEAKPEADLKDTHNFDEAEITKLIQQRNEARKVKDYAQSDRIREQLQQKGITLIDRPNGETSVVSVDSSYSLINFDATLKTISIFIEIVFKVASKLISE